MMAGMVSPSQQPAAPLPLSRRIRLALLLLLASSSPVCVSSFSAPSFAAFCPRDRNRRSVIPKVFLIADTPSSRRTSSQRRNLASPQDGDVVPVTGEQQSSDELRASKEATRRLDSRCYNQSFNSTTALLCGGLAFDSYVEPPSDSARWERGSRGLNIAFVSPAFTRNVYKGLLEVTPMRVEGLPGTEDNVAEQVLTGSGVDACLLVAALEGSWKEDIERLEKEQYNQGVLDLTGAAHVGRSRTAWSTTDEKKSEGAKKRYGKASPYHIKASWGKDAQAVWPEPEPFYLYLQDPVSVRLVLTVIDDDRIGGGSPVGSTHVRLQDLIPQARLKPDQVIDALKEEVIQQLQSGNIDSLNDRSIIEMGAKSWSGRLKLTSKPRKKSKSGQIFAGAAAGAALAGPAGAAAGALMANLYEGQVKGSVILKLRYLPIPQVPVKRTKYTVYGGMPGITWGKLYERHLERNGIPESASPLNDLEHCFFVNHDKTGATCAVYRSLEKKLIVVSFRGTCEPIDLLTDVSIIQDPWVEEPKGEEIEKGELKHEYPMVHAGFRSSLNSITRRLKELLLATVPRGERLADYDLLVTGHR